MGFAIVQGMSKRPAFKKAASVLQRNMPSADQVMRRGEAITREGVYAVQQAGVSNTPVRRF